jgi:hypothetical protein
VRQEGTELEERHRRRRWPNGVQALGGGKGIRQLVKQRRGAVGKHSEEERWTAEDAREDGGA